MKHWIFLALLLPACQGSMARNTLTLAASHNCLTCHTVSQRVIGPAFRSVAARYRNQPDAMEQLTAKIREGGRGIYGTVPMPASPQVSEDEARQLAQWILHLH